MARQNIDGSDFVGGNGRTKLNENFTELYLSQPPLPEDTYAEADPITDWPEGISEMAVSATASWFYNSGLPGMVVTHHTPNGGFQFGTYDEQTSVYKRQWDNVSLLWNGWYEIVDNSILSGALADISIYHVSPYGDDFFAEADPITDWPLGISIMAASAAADWNSNGEAATVVTKQSSVGGHQEIHYESGWMEQRWADGAGWQPWITVPEHTHTRLRMSTTDAQAESTAITLYEDGLSIMPVTAGANWGPNVGEAGHVATERNGLSGEQTFHQYSNATSYRRTYTGGAWGSWAAFSMEGHTHREPTELAAGTPTEGYVIKIVSGVPTWSAP